MTIVVKTQGLSKRYGKNRGISDVSLEISQGEVFGFLGPNGAGKTTTMRLLLGMLHPDAGEAYIGGLNCWSQALQVKRLIGYLPAEFFFDGSLRGSQIITYLANLRGSVDKQYIASLIKRLRLDPDKKFREYSHGNKQKVGLVQALMHRPSLLILDEPTGGLDPLIQQVFYQLVAEARSSGQTVFLSSHNLPEVEQVCDNVGIIREGHLVTVSQVTDLKDMKQQEVTLLFPKPVEPALFANVPGVISSRQGANDRTLLLTVQENMQAVMRAAADNQALQIHVHEPSLEDIFMRYYEQKV